MLNWIVVPIFLIGLSIWWVLKLLGKFMLDVLKSFYGKLVTFLGAVVFLYFIAYISGLIGK